MNISVHIERLVLDGLPVTGHQGPLLQAAVERELTRLLTDDSSIAQFNAGGPLASINGGSFDVAERADPATLGEQIAAAVHGGLGGGHE
jgi:hypothetical protein